MLGSPTWKYLQFAGKVKEGHYGGQGKPVRHGQEGLHHDVVDEEVGGGGKGNANHLRDFACITHGRWHSQGTSIELDVAKHTRNSNVGIILAIVQVLTVAELL